MIYIVLPAYNEEEAIKPLFERLADAAAKLAEPLEIILADDGSSDNTADTARQTAERLKLTLTLVQHGQNQGLGQTINMGLSAFLAQGRAGDFACTMDCDNTQPPELIASMLKLAQAGGLDIVIASRYQSGSAVKGLSVPRILLSLGASGLFQLFYPVPGLKDYTCGFRLYRFEFLKALQQHYGDRLFTEPGFSCMADILLKARVLSPKVGEVAMVLRYDEKCGKSKMRVLRTILQTLKLLLKHANRQAPTDNLS